MGNLFTFLVQEKIDILSEKLERESCVGDKQNIDFIEFETTGKNPKVKCKSIYNSNRIVFILMSYKYLILVLKKSKGMIYISIIIVVINILWLLNYLSTHSSTMKPLYSAQYLAEYSGKLG